jgi:hypothetical protein
MRRNVFLFVMLVVVLMACQKEITDALSSDSPTLLLKKKWVLPASNNLNYQWIEFAPGNTYIILDKNGDSHAGKYTLSADGKSVILAGLGTMQISSLTSTALNFSLQLNGSGTPLAATSLAATQRIHSLNTDMVCQYWNLYKSYDYMNAGVYDTVLYPQTNQNSAGMIKGEVIFSTFGTYFVTTIDKTFSGYDTSYLNGVWNWVNATETSINYHEATDTLNTGLLNLEELTNANLRFNEDSSIYFLTH